MTNDLNTTVQAQASSEQPVISEGMSFTEYEKARRAGAKIESEPALVAKPEQKEVANSELAKKEDVDSEDADDESNDESEGSDKPKKEGGFKRKINKLISQREAAKKELDYWKTEALKSKAPAEQKSEQPKVETASKAEGKPSPDSFETHAEYVEALTDWKIEQREAKSRQDQEKSKLQSEYQERVNSHLEREKAFMKATDDYKEIVGELMESQPYVSPTFEQLLTASDNGPAILYELAKDRAEFDRINQLHPIAAAREFGKIEARLSAKPSEESKPEPKKITSAPKPIEPVGKSSSGSVPKSIEDMSFSEYEKHRRAQLNRRR